MEKTAIEELVSSAKKRSYVPIPCLPTQAQAQEHETRGAQKQEEEEANRAAQLQTQLVNEAI